MTLYFSQGILWLDGWVHLRIVNSLDFLSITLLPITVLPITVLPITVLPITVLPMTLLLGLMAVVLGIPIFVFTLECFASLFPHRAPVLSLHRPRIAVLMPAHNEAMGIAETLKTVSPQLVEDDRLIVIADNCDDQTTAIAQSMGATVTERHNLEQQGKGYALAHGLTVLHDDPPAVVVMLDADCTVHPGTIERIARAAIAQQRPVQALYLMTPPAKPGPKAAVSVLAFIVKNWVRPQGLDRLGLPCLLTGTGMAFPWAVINSVPLGTGNIVEDMQLAVDLAIAGYPPKFCFAGQVTGQLPQQASATVSQRMRWEHGHLTTLLTQVPRLWTAAFQQKRIDLLAMAGDLSVPPLSLLVMLWGGLTAIAALMSQFGWPGWPLQLLGLEGFGLLSSILLAWLRFGRDRLPMQALLVVPLYILWKIPLYLTFILRPQTRWVRTERDTIDVPKP
jgi:cellulose synthase/poly-beta-1,6-N-acetylglucosamine synthase-like glycosyltransferase